MGAKGQNNLVACGPDLDEAKEIFTKKCVLTLSIKSVQCSNCDADDFILFRY